MAVIDPQMPQFPSAAPPVLKIAVVIGSNTFSIEGPFTVPEAVLLIQAFIGALTPVPLPAGALSALTSSLSAANTRLEQAVAAAP